jgi:ankyrin repeat protein
MYAAMANHALNAVKCLVSSGVKVNARDANGWTPLHWVSDVPIAKYLVSHKADVSIRDRNGITPLGYAVDEGNEEVAEYLRSLGSEE